MPEKAKARFIDPMLLLKTEKLPEGPDALNEIKLDGYRSIAFKTGGKAHLRSRNDNDFASRYPSIAKALQAMPDETVIDGEVVALDATEPSFNLLQNYASSKPPLIFYAFDVMILSGKDIMAETLETRRSLLKTKVLPEARRAHWEFRRRSMRTVPSVSARSGVQLPRAYGKEAQ